jgi:hypothetical protein
MAIPISEGCRCCGCAGCRVCPMGDTPGTYEFFRSSLRATYSYACPDPGGLCSGSGVVSVSSGVGVNYYHDRVIAANGGEAFAPGDDRCAYFTVRAGGFGDLFIVQGDVRRNAAGGYTLTLTAILGVTLVTECAACAGVPTETPASNPSATFDFDSCADIPFAGGLPLEWEAVFEMSYGDITVNVSLDCGPPGCDVCAGVMSTFEVHQYRANGTECGTGRTITLAETEHRPPPGPGGYGWREYTGLNGSGDPDPAFGSFVVAWTLDGSGNRRLCVTLLEPPAPATCTPSGGLPFCVGTTPSTWCVYPPSNTSCETDPASFEWRYQDDDYCYVLTASIGCPA